jgi:tetratricopeptide (TPR) repeat protein
MAHRSGSSVRLAFALLLLATCARSPAPPAEPGYRLVPGLGDHHHAITTRSPVAQQYFDQGLTLTYAFNHDAAIKSFDEALRHDPGCAMCYWGVSFANGANINAPMGPDGERAAKDALARAQALAPKASPREQAYIAALAPRYAEGVERAAADRAFADAMRELHRADPLDDDAATLFADAQMNLSPWRYWSADGEPTGHTAEFVATLEAVLARNPRHIGANHAYIHAVEASRTPERALPSAERLAELAPGAGHLVHMPSHVFWRVGRYADSVEWNQRAIAVDEALFSWCRSSAMYRGAYYPHNIHFLWSAALTEGRAELALTTARDLAAKADAVIAEFPPAEQFSPLAIATLARFGRWDALLGEPAPPPERRYSTGMWHYGRALAFVRRKETERAKAELAEVERIAQEDSVKSLDFAYEFADKLLRIAAHHLRGELAAARRDWKTAERELAAAIELDDGMQYTEPPRWHFPVRQALGAVQLRAGRAAAAEATYREDLRRNPGTGWSLYGLAQSLRKQGKRDDAAIVSAGFAESWARADVKLESSIF